MTVSEYTVGMSSGLGSCLLEATEIPAARASCVTTICSNARNWLSRRFPGSYVREPAARRARHHLLALSGCLQVVRARGIAAGCQDLPGSACQARIAGPEVYLKFGLPQPEQLEALPPFPPFPPLPPSETQPTIPKLWRFSTLSIATRVSIEC